ncbi:hypothetical protein [Nocardia xishanensis]|uniref:hypothetical protein n=1 Tax=Nocardia xishanensis TaxID=238964 RepID=UPI0012F4B527|nr:hypothetical protein [Nocardia xishanensis]
MGTGVDAPTFPAGIDASRGHWAAETLVEQPAATTGRFRPESYPEVAAQMLAKQRSSAI